MKSFCCLAKSLKIIFIISLKFHIYRVLFTSNETKDQLCLCHWDSKSPSKDPTWPPLLFLKKPNNLKLNDLSQTYLKLRSQGKPPPSNLERDKFKEFPPRSAYTGPWNGNDYLNVNFDSFLEAECELAWVAIDLGSKEAPYFHMFYH